jgi:hydroxymethylbilane synthase
MAERGPKGRTLRLGTRGSKLARWQAGWVAGELRRLGHVVEIVEIATRGDWEQGSAVASLGATGVFTKEIQRALLMGDVDLAVHSLKDLPTEATAGLTIAAIPARASAADVLVARDGMALKDLPNGACVGTGSMRRQAQLLHVRPDLRVAEIRGNVDTRLRKLDDGQFDAIILAEAGLQRLGLAHRITQVLPFDVMLPAPAQGALAVECRTDDERARTALAQLDDLATHHAVILEREVLARLRAGCSAPVGAYARRETGGKILLTAVVLSVDGKQRIETHGDAEPVDVLSLGQRVAEELLAKGAGELIAATRTGYESHHG